MAERTYTLWYRGKDSIASSKSLTVTIPFRPTYINDDVIANIPKYSTISKAVVYLKIARDGSSSSTLDTDIYWVTRNSSNVNISEFDRQANVVATSAKEFSHNFTSYFESNTKNAGLINSSLCDHIGAVCSGSATRTYTATERRIEYKFVPPTYTINATAGTGGTVSGDIGTFDVTVADQVKTITAHSNAGYRFVGWRNSSGTIISGNVSLQVIISQNNISSHSTTETFTAVFEPADNDLNYDNLFSFAGWKNSVSSSPVGTGKVSANVTSGTITLSDCSGDFYTEFGGRAGFYTIPVEAGQEYRLNYNAQHTGDIRVFVFYYDANGNFIYVSPYGEFFTYSTNPNGFSFTPPLTSYDGTSSKCAYIDIRFGTYSEGFYANATFSDIAIYKTSWNTHEITNRQYRKVFTVGNELGILYEPERPGYVFQGWYTGENGTGQHIRKIDTLPANTTVYSHWVKRSYYDVNYDNLFSFSDWAYSPSGRPQGLSDSAYIGTISTDIPNGTVTVKGADPNGSAFYTMYGSFSPYHHIPVQAGQQYAFRYNVSQTYNMQAFVFFCNDNQDFVTDPSTGLQFVFDTNGDDLEFIPPEGCTNVCFRLGVGGINTAVFSNIGLYKVSSEQVITNRPIRKNISYGSAVGTLSTPSKEGYTFKGWYTGESGSGFLVTSSNSFLVGTTIYSLWEEIKPPEFKSITLTRSTDLAKVTIDTPVDAGAKYIISVEVT